MVIIQSFVNNIAKNNPNIINNFLTKSDAVLNALFTIPFMVLNQFGTFFILITGMVSTISVLSVIRKKKMSIGRYLLGRLFYGVLLCFYQSLCTSITNNSDIFKNNRIEFFPIVFSESAEVLDAVAWIGFLIPLIIVIFMKIPIFNKQWKIHIGLLYVFLIGWFFLMHSLNYISEQGYHFFQSSQWYMIAHLLKKIYDGPYCISYSFLYGLYGAIWGIFLRNMTSWKSFSIFSIVNEILLLLVGIVVLFLLVPTSQIFEQIISTPKPYGFIILSLFLEMLLLILCIELLGSPSKLEQLLKRRTNTLWLRKLSCISLTLFLLDPFIAKYLLRIMEIAWGSAVNMVTEEIQWHFFTILIFIILHVLVIVLLSYGWEKVCFLYDIENQILAILHWFLDFPTNKNDYALILYEPMLEIQKIIELKKNDAECMLSFSHLLIPLASPESRDERSHSHSLLPSTILSQKLNERISTPMSFQGLPLDNLSPAAKTKMPVEDEIMIFEPQVVVDERELKSL